MPWKKLPKYRLEHMRHPLAPWEEMATYATLKDAKRAYNSVDLKIAKMVQLIKIELIACKADKGCFEKD